MFSKEIAFASDGSRWVGTASWDYAGVRRVKDGETIADVHRTPDGRWFGVGRTGGLLLWSSDGGSPRQIDIDPSMQVSVIRFDAKGQTAIRDSLSPYVNISLAVATHHRQSGEFKITFNLDAVAEITVGHGTSFGANRQGSLARTKAGATNVPTTA